MNYYIAKKTDIQNYFIQNSEPNGITPDSFIPQFHIDRLNSYVSQAKMSVLNLDEELNNNIERIKENISYISHQLLRKPEGLSKNEVSFLKQYLDRDNSYLTEKDLAFIDKYDTNLLKSYSKNTINSIFFQYYVTNIAKRDAFASILTLVNTDEQKNIINLDLGTDSIVVTDPIKNLTGLYQLHASVYNNIDNLIFYSTSNPNLVAQEIPSAQAIDPSSEQVKKLFENRDNYISYEYLLNFNDYILANKDTQVVQEINDIENLKSILRKNENLPIEDFTPLLKKALHCFFEDSKNHDVNNIINFMNSFASYEEDIFNSVYVDILKELLSGDISKNKQKIRAFSPQSFYFQNQLDTKKTFQLLEKNFTSVEVAYVYANYFKNKHDNHFIINQPNDSVTYNISIKTAAEGETFNAKSVSYLGKDLAQLLQKISIRVAQNDPEIFKEFNKAEFIDIRKDIYPFLQLKDKLNYQNYECFLETGFKGLFFEHLTSLPSSLFENEDLFTQYSEYLQMVDLKHYNYGFKEKYLSVVISTKLESNIQQFITTGEEINTDFSLLFQNENLLSHTLNNLSQNMGSEQIFNFLINYDNKYPSNPLTYNFSKQLFILENVSKTIDADSFITYCDTFNIMDTSRDKYKIVNILNKFSQNPNFHGKNEQEAFLLNAAYRSPQLINNELSSKLISFYVKPEIVEKIITYYKNKGQVCTSPGYDLSDGFKSPHFSNAIFSKANFKKVTHFGLDLYHLNPHIIYHLPQEILGDKSVWMKFIDENITDQSPPISFNKKILPIHLANDKELFNFALDKTLQKISKSNINSSILSSFSPLMLHQEEFILKLFKASAQDYESNKNLPSKIISLIKSFNEGLASTFEQIYVRAKNNDTNEFQTVIDGIENIKMTQHILNNKSEVQTTIKSRKF